MENISADTFDEGLISKFYLKTYKTQHQKAYNSIKIWAKDLNRYCSKEDTQIVNRHMKDGQCH